MQDEFSDEDLPYREHGMGAKVKDAKQWIRRSDSVRKLDFFEVEIDRYPGDERAFIFAWVDARGGI